MLHFQGHPGLTTNEDVRSLFGGGRLAIPWPGSTRGDSWHPRALAIYAMTHSRDAATGSGNAFTVDTYVGGATLKFSFSMTNADGTSKQTNYSSVTLPAAATSAYADSIQQLHLLTGSPTADGAFAYVYQDPTNPALSFHCAGDGASNFAAAGVATRYISIHGTGTTGSTTEANANVVWPRAGTMSTFAIRYGTGSGEAYTMAIRKNNADAATIAIPASTSALILNTTTQVALAAGDRICFAFTRVTTSTLLVANVVFGFEAT